MRAKAGMGGVSSGTAAGRPYANVATAAATQITSDGPTKEEPFFESEKLDFDEDLGAGEDHEPAALSPKPSFCPSRVGVRRVRLEVARAATGDEARRGGIVWFFLFGAVCTKEAGLLSTRSFCPRAGPQVKSTLRSD